MQGVEDEEQLIAVLMDHMEDGNHEIVRDICHKLKPTSTTQYILGQLSFGIDAINYYATGIQLDNNKVSILSAYLAMIEIYMTDLCDQPDASELCDSLISKAMSLGINTSDLYFAIADVRICQMKNELALEAIFLGIDKLVIENQDDKTLASYEYMIKGTKVAIELNQIDHALAILSYCEKEFDENLDFLYLSAFCHLQKATFDPIYKETCEDYISKLNELDTENEFIEGITQIQESLSKQ